MNWADKLTKILRPYTTSGLERPSPGGFGKDPEIILEGERWYLKVQVPMSSRLTHVADTGSMDPFIDAADPIRGEAKDWAVMAPAKSVTLGIGDIVTQFSPLSGNYVLHPIVSERQHNGRVQYQTMGTNNATPDPWWTTIEGFKEIMGITIFGRRSDQ